ncbi:MAG: type II toxin-antitoxin system prevent-host-death family antitoxin [Tannerella sp.]|nr:type II toxin-antitoxin system prevent-host-death family antitoxin [Tannerella sp.]
MQVATYSELRNNLRSYLNSVIEDNDTVIIGQSNGRAGVLISLAEYNAIKETEYLNSSKKMVEAIERGEEQIRSGHVRVKRPDESMEDFLNRAEN